jgi:hypothetical protein
VTALAELGPLAHVAEIGGPEILTLEAMTEAYLRIRGRTATIRSEPTANPMFDTFRSGIILTPDHAVGVTTWTAYLEQKYARQRATAGAAPGA